ISTAVHPRALGCILCAAPGQRSSNMSTARFMSAAVAAVGLALFSTSPQLTTYAQQPAVANDNIGGVVTSAKGPEAGVWVIAETTDLPTRFIKIVVTDDQGRYLVPDLPKANYDVWVRGYGLVDSPKVKSTPGKNLNLNAIVAPDKKAEVQYYPAL